ncbi:MAG: sigma-54-dependent Fis family transcriptional regulator, partial [Polyangiaceae bacterium]|nr:sigma-54-dependent Fis family transcriptional regulator [Polyangiaceae bacterium]
VQVKLLRVLEDGKVMRLGGRAPRALDVRFIAATNRDLAEEIREGTFREDLFFRLNGMTLAIPPLRERVAEIGPLAEVFARRACELLDRARVPAIAKEALAILEGYRWPGNARELRNVVERAVLLAGHEERILPEHLPPELIARGSGSRSPGERALRPEPQLARPGAPARAAAPEGLDSLEALEAKRREIERRQIVEALEKCGYNQTKAAQMLGIARRTMTYKMTELRIDGPRVRRGGPEEPGPEGD